MPRCPLTPENTWDNRGKPEHIGLKVFNLSEGEWVTMNDRSRATTQERLNHTQLVPNPDLIAQRALALLLSDDWAELVVGIALSTGRRLAEIMKTGEFSVKSAYTIWFTGQVKEGSRIQERFELPTLVRAYLVMEAMARLRSLVDCREMEIDQVSQKYGKAVNETVERVYGDVIPARSDRERLSVHNLRNLYASIAVLWYCPDQVTEVNYKAYVHGHRFVLEPRVEEGKSADEVERIRLDYGSHANYDHYKIADAEGKLDGRHGIKLGQPGVVVLDFFRGSAPVVEEPVKTRGKKRVRKKAASENKTGFSTLKPTVATKEWVDDERFVLEKRLSREVKDDELIRRLLIGYLGGTGPQSGERATLSLEDLPLMEQTRALFQQALA